MKLHCSFFYWQFKLDLATMNSEETALSLESFSPSVILEERN